MPEEPPLPLCPKSVMPTLAQMIRDHTRASSHWMQKICQQQGDSSSGCGCFMLLYKAICCLGSSVLPSYATAQNKEGKKNPLDANLSEELKQVCTRRQFQQEKNKREQPCLKRCFRSLPILIARDSCPPQLPIGIPASYLHPSLPAPWLCTQGRTNHCSLTQRSKLRAVGSHIQPTTLGLQVLPRWQSQKIAGELQQLDLTSAPGCPHQPRHTMELTYQ